MGRLLVENMPFGRFSETKTGWAPGVSVTLRLPVSGRRIPGIHALIDTGCELTRIYQQDVLIGPDEMDYDHETNTYLIGVELGGQIYDVRCQYMNFRYAGKEDMLIGMDLISNWLMIVHGKRRLLSLTHLEVGD